MKTKRLLLLVTTLLALRLSAVEIIFKAVAPEIVRQRLGQFAGKNTQREQTLKKIFSEAGCDSEHLSEQKVKHEEAPNLICLWPGESDDTIIVGAHFDRVARGAGVVDNWSGASLLPSLLEALRAQSRHHTLIFIAFTGEEDGMVGSEFYVKSMGTDQRSRVQAMVNMDTLGLGPTEVWASHADPKLTTAIATVARAMSLPVSGMNVEQVGSTDSESFRKVKIPAITIHTLTTKTLPILHSADDQLKQIKFPDYYETYKLMAAYLAYLDGFLPAAAKPGPAGTK